MFLRSPSQAKLAKHSWPDPQLYGSQAGENRGVVNALKRTGDGLLSASRTSPSIFADIVTGREGGMFLKRPSQANLPSFGYLFVIEQRQLDSAQLIGIMK